MSIFDDVAKGIGGFFSGGLTTVISKVGGIISALTGDDPEKQKQANEALKILNDFKIEAMSFEAEYERQLTQRLKADMLSDSWLSKNIRPLALAFLTIATFGLAYSTIFILPVEKVELVKPWIVLLTSLDITAYGFYFGSRGLEKYRKIKNG